MKKLLILLLVLALAAAACSSSDAEPTTTTTVAPTTSTAAPTTTSSTTTTEPPPTTVTLDSRLGVKLIAEVETVYNRIIDPSNPEPNGLTDSFDALLAEADASPGVVSATGNVATLENGDKVGVVSVNGDVLFLVDTGDGWRTVGALFDGLDPWFGDRSPRNLLVIGSDAREGEDQLHLRADSIHILTMVPEIGEGAFVGFPRDSWVLGSKMTDLMPGRGPDGMQEIIEDLTSLELEGWVAVGFEGFLGLMEELGSLEIDLPTEMRSGNTWDDYPAGPQVLNPQLALRLARIRKGLPAGDFDRSYNQGLVMLAAMVMIQEMGVEELPRWVAAYDTHGFTNLDTEDFFTWAASAYVTTPEQITNMVIPASVGTVGAASVVFISDSAELVYRDLEDGLIEPTEN